MQPMTRAKRGSIVESLRADFQAEETRILLEKLDTFRSEISKKIKDAFDKCQEVVLPSAAEILKAHSNEELDNYLKILENYKEEYAIFQGILTLPDKKTVSVEILEWYDKFINQNKKMEEVQALGKKNGQAQELFIVIKEQRAKLESIKQNV